MSIFTRARNAVTGTVRDVASSVGNVAQTGFQIYGGLMTNPLGTIGGLAGMLGGGMGGQLPMMGQGGGTMQTSGLGGYQNNLENLSQMIGQPQVSQTSTTSGGGLI